MKRLVILFILFFLFFNFILYNKVSASTESAYSYILMDMDSNNILLSKNKDERRLIASITKIMTI